jgi:transcription antitermination factor NusG
MDDDFQAGDRVRIKEGPLAGLVGIFQRNAGSNDRVSVLMTTIKYQSHVTIDRQLIEKH